MESFSYTIIALNEFFKIEFSLFAFGLYAMLCGAMGGVGLWIGQKALNYLDKNFRIKISLQQVIFYGSIFLPIMWLSINALDATVTSNSGRLIKALRGGLAVAMVSALAIKLYHNCLRFNLKLLPVRVSKRTPAGTWENHHVVHVHSFIVFGIGTYETVFIYFQILLNEKLAAIYHYYSLKVAAMIFAGWFASGVVSFLTAVAFVGLVSKIFGVTTLVKYSKDNVVPFETPNEVENDKAAA